LQIIINEACPSADVRGRVGRLGAFELLVNGQMVYSKLATGKFPDFPTVATVVAKVQDGEQPEMVLKHSPSCALL